MFHGLLKVDMNLDYFVIIWIINADKFSYIMCGSLKMQKAP